MDGEILARLERFPADSGDFRQSARRITMIPHPGNVPIPLHTRDYVELVYMCRGESRHSISGNDIALRQGELLLLGQNTPQQMLAGDSAALAVRFLIKPEFFGDILAYLGSEETPLREFILKCLGQETPYGYLHFHVADVKPVQNLVENLLWHLLTNPESRRAIPLYTVGLLFVHLLDESDKVTIGIRQQQAVLGVLRYIETNYVSGSLTQAAEFLHCDITWLSREIKRRTGKTYTDLVQERRLVQAAWLLEHTRQKVSDIAVAVGYENISYFHRIFRKQFGISPKKYRDNL